MAIDFKTCKRCKGLFQSFGSPFCPKCQDEMDEEFVKIRNYVYDHPSAKLHDVIKDTQVSEGIVLFFLKEGRLVLSGGIQGLTCESCGKPILSGKFCENCKTRFGKELDSMADKIKSNAENRGPRMHTDFRNKE